MTFCFSIGLDCQSLILQYRSEGSFEQAYYNFTYDHSLCKCLDTSDTDHHSRCHMLLATSSSRILPHPAPARSGRRSTCDRVWWVNAKAGNKAASRPPHFICCPVCNPLLSGDCMRRRDIVKHTTEEDCCVCYGAYRFDGLSPTGIDKRLVCEKSSTQRNDSRWEDP